MSESYYHLCGICGASVGNCLHTSRLSEKADILREYDFLTVAEVAAYLHVSKMTVYRLLERGDLRGYRFERNYRVDRGDLLAYVAQARVP